MSNRDKKYGGLVRYDHEHKLIFLQRNLESPHITRAICQ